MTYKIVINIKKKREKEKMYVIELIEYIIKLHNEKPGEFYNYNSRFDDDYDKICSITKELLHKIQSNKILNNDFKYFKKFISLSQNKQIFVKFIYIIRIICSTKEAQNFFEPIKEVVFADSNSLVMKDFTNYSSINIQSIEVLFNIDFSRQSDIWNFKINPYVDNIELYSDKDCSYCKYFIYCSNNAKSQRILKKYYSSNMLDHVMNLILASYALKFYVGETYVLTQCCQYVLLVEFIKYNTDDAFQKKHHNKIMLINKCIKNTQDKTH